MLALTAPPANLSPWRGRENQPDGRWPTILARISVVRSRRARSSSRLSRLTSSCLKPWAAISWPSPASLRIVSAWISAITAGTANVALSP